MTLADTNVLLDVATDDPKWARWSLRQLAAAATRGPVVINAIVYSELRGRRKLALAYCLGQQRIDEERTATRPRRYNFRHHAITVRDQYGFTASSKADIFTKLVLEEF